MSQLKFNVGNGKTEIITTLYPIERIMREIFRMKLEISNHYLDIQDDRELAVVCVLNGSKELTEKLYPMVEHPRKYLDHIRVKSYEGTKSTGNLRILVELEHPVVNKHVLIVEDIVDTGRTLTLLKKLILERGAASVRVVSLLDKPAGRKVQIEADHVGITLVGSPFIVGFGLDYNERYRQLPYIGVLSFHGLCLTPCETAMNREEEIDAQESTARL